jgi:hypothetical protein
MNKNGQLNTMKKIILVVLLLVVMVPGVIWLSKSLSATTTQYSATGDFDNDGDTNAVDICKCGTNKLYVDGEGAKWCVAFSQPAMCKCANELANKQKLFEGGIINPKESDKTPMFIQQPTANGNIRCVYQNPSCTELIKIDPNFMAEIAQNPGKTPCDIGVEHNPVGQ